MNEMSINTRTRLMAVLACASLLVAIALVAQEIPSDEVRWVRMPYVPQITTSPVIRVQSDLVEVATTVADNHGKPVSNLGKDDFLLFDNGKPQTISTFSVQAGLQDLTTAQATPASGGAAASPTVQPRYIALFFDDANTTYQNLYFARQGAIKLIRKGLDPGERVGIFTASQTLTLDFTDDTQKLLATLNKLRLFQRMSDQGAFACPPESPYQAWVIVHFGGKTDELLAAIKAASYCCGGAAESCARTEAEAVTSNAESYSLDTLHSIEYVIRHLGEMPGRRILVVASSGFLTMSFGQQTQKIVEAALRANIVINSLDSAGLDPNRDLFDAHFSMVLPMSDLALGTGGKFLHNGNDLAEEFHTLTTVPSVSYILGFSPTDLRIDGTEHKLKVKLREPPHLTVNARPSYYAPSNELSSPEKKFKKLQADVMSSENSSEIPVQFTAVPETLRTGELSLKMLLYVDIRKLPFREYSDRRAERLIFITALFDEKNQFVTGVESVMDLRLKSGTLKRLSTQGLDAKLSISAPAGSYRVRQVVQEVVGGRITALSRAVEIH
jgi:VWFA-related protein